jgi:polyisoprenoid-binding protein YceI
MKNVILLIVVVLTAISCKSDSKNKIDTTEAKDVIEVETSKALLIDAGYSKVIWKGFKPGGEHYGLITISEGTISIIDGNLIGGAFKFDMSSITDSDMPIDDEMNAKLVGHLKSADFFDVERFPTSTFEITDISDLGGDLKISGNLTIKATTKNITIPAALISNNGRVTLKSDVFTVDRTDFNVRYGSKRFFDNLKDKFINDEFELSFELNTIQ